MRRPEFITDEHLKYLDNLRNSGETNMYGASPYIQQEFAVSNSKAKVILKYWMKTFTDRHKNKW